MTELTPLKAIRKKCMECSNHSTKEVRLCPIKDCPLWPYRLGKNPKRSGVSGVTYNFSLNKKKGS